MGSKKGNLKIRRKAVVGKLLKGLAHHTGRFPQLPHQCGVACRSSNLRLDTNTMCSFGGLQREALGTILAVHGRVAWRPHPCRYVLCGPEIGPKRRQRATTRLSAARALALPFATTRFRHRPRHSSLNAFTGLVRAPRQAGPAQARRPMPVTIPRTAAQVAASSNCVP
jgi:hypothetical protein